MGRWVDGCLSSSTIITSKQEFKNKICSRLELTFNL